MKKVVQKIYGGRFIGDKKKLIFLYVLEHLLIQLVRTYS